MEHGPGAMLRRQEALGRGYSDDEIRRLYTWRVAAHRARRVPLRVDVLGAE
ncbi:hypothetical protein [Rhodococcus sp. WB9]|uniref:hypothetical protein n=1 Tax=Rhodococcus sp. WB9 TaxID=2594007 RepID=UPI0021B3DB9B|nr:hypothetical protein [Rhodococcus sp. WB9]